MYGAELRWTEYRPPTEDWDHAHCALCWATFADDKQEDAARAGYLFESPDPHAVTLSEEERTFFVDGSRIVKAPTEDEWVCAACFTDFKSRFGWTAREN